MQRDLALFILLQPLREVTGHACQHVLHKRVQRFAGNHFIENFARGD